MIRACDPIGIAVGEPVYVCVYVCMCVCVCVYMCMFVYVYVLGRACCGMVYVCDVWGCVERVHRRERGKERVWACGFVCVHCTVHILRLHRPHLQIWVPSPHVCVSMSVWMWVGECVNV
jgi:hypothetical protein